jgi:hypothetical protein
MVRGAHPTWLYELNGETQVSVLPDIVIQWDELVTRLPVDY